MEETLISSMYARIIIFTRHMAGMGSSDIPNRHMLT